jgi:sulfur-oxidizing protein SoxZ
MAKTVLTRLSFLGDIQSGRSIEARWICNHPMETGFRVDDSGRKIPRNIITQVECKLNDKVILQVQPGTGWSSPAYLSFSFTVPPEGGMVTVSWVDDAGESGQMRQALLLKP